MVVNSTLRGKHTEFPHVLVEFRFVFLRRASADFLPSDTAARFFMT